MSAWETIKEIITPIAAIITIIMFFVGAQLYLPIHRIGSQRRDKPILFRALILKHTERSTSGWKLFKRLTITASLILLGGLGLTIYVIIDNQANFDAGIIIVLIFLVALPLYLIYDITRSDRRLQEGKGSRVRKSSELKLLADYDTLIIRCQQALADMRAYTISMDSKKGDIEAALRNSKLNIQIRRIRGQQYKISITSDSHWPSVIYDFGANQKNLDEFSQRLLGLK